MSLRMCTSAAKVREERESDVELAMAVGLRRSERGRCDCHCRSLWYFGCG